MDPEPVERVEWVEWVERARGFCILSRVSCILPEKEKESLTLPFGDLNFNCPLQQARVPPRLG